MPVWGLEGVYAPSALRVFLYHLLIVVWPIAFWIWWQVNHPEDYQNAAVPITATLGLVSLFWVIYVYTTGHDEDGRSEMKNR